MRALVTGGGGFIGSHVVRQLVATGHQVRVLHLPGEDLRNLEDLRGRVELVEGDVRDNRRVRQVVRGSSHVFHLAAVFKLWTNDRELMREVNVGGTRNVLRAALEEGVARVVHTSSIAVFGGQGPGVDGTEESPYRLGRTGDLYSESKHQAHLLAEDFARGDLDVTIVAPCGPLGPGDVGPTPPGKLLLTTLRLPIVPVVDTETNFIDVRDCAAGHLLAMAKGARGRSYLLGAENLHYRELARMALDAAGLDKPIVTLPLGPLGPLARAAGWAADLTKRAPLVTHPAWKIAQLGLRADASRARRELGLVTRDLRESVGDALAWFRRQGYHRGS